ncbi:M23 family metallopeptidase [Roseibium sp.]|uniref:M23 family metallopeptidase n=1 Tax=Roseibium sp. TaxID=1936156 RepID=UPI0032991783
MAATLVVAGSASYFLLRPDAADTSNLSQTKMVVQYQDRIERLRAEIERLTSRQIVDRESVEIQVMDVLRRQHDLNQRHSIVADLVARAESVGIYLNSGQPVPTQKPFIDSRDLASIEENDSSAIGGQSEIIKEPVKALGLRDSSSKGFDPLKVLQGASPETSDTDSKKNSKKQAALSAVKANISEMGTESTVAIDAITVATESRIDDILGITKSLVPGLHKALGKNPALGGPFLPVDEVRFSDRLSRANTALKTLKRVKFAALRLPVKRPVRNAKISSGYGPRMDPFLRRLAMHTGIDFKASYGARVFATAPGTVIKAGWKGGYGKMIEIRHANGFVTRYAHLSKMRVHDGDHVVAGDVIGNVGSTGRSTGPHLHYEVRRHDKPSDPYAYMRAGEKMADLSL